MLCFPRFGGWVSSLGLIYLTSLGAGCDGSANNSESNSGDGSNGATASDAADETVESGPDTNDGGEEDIDTPSWDPEEGSDDAEGDDDNEGEGGDGHAELGESGIDDCGEMEFEGKRTTPRVVLLLDKSGSMTQESWVDNGETVTRWKSLHRIVSGLVRDFEDVIEFGAKVFPHLESSPNDICGVFPGLDVDVGLGQADKILSVLPGENATLHGGTPSATALRETVVVLKELGDEEPRAIVLVMDGLTEDCDDTDQLLQAAARMSKNEGIPVYVVGIDLVSDKAQHSLALLAQSGGTGTHFQSTDAQELSDAMQEIVGEIASCKIPLDPPPGMPDLVKVYLNGDEEIEALLDYTSCEDAAEAGFDRGWVYTSNSVPRKALELCGSACEDYFEAGKVNLTYECPPPM